MNIQIEFINLLHSLKSKGLFPKKPSSDEKYLNPFDRKVYRSCNLSVEQRNRFLWIPSEKGLKGLGLDIDSFEMEGLRIMELRIEKSSFQGAGPNVTEALLSLLKQVVKLEAA